MKFDVVRNLLAVGFLGLSCSSGLTQIIVYQNSGGTDAYLTLSGGTAGTAGDLVTLSGAANTVSAFTVGLLGSGDVAGTTADLSLSFYNPGPNVTVGTITAPSVGTQIGSTVTQPGVTVQNGVFNVTFSGLSITVPNDVIWAVSINNLTGTGSLSWTFSLGPTVGSSDPTFAYTALPISFPLTLTPQANSLSPPSNLTATITAVPESALYPVIFAALCFGLIWHRRRLATA